jgi:hypothetical protein
MSKAYNFSTCLPSLTCFHPFTDFLVQVYQHWNVCCKFHKVLHFFNVGKSVHHHTIQINQPTRCNCFTSLLLDVLCRSTCFGHLRAHHQELTTALTASGFTLKCGGSSAVSRGPAGSRLTTLLPPRSKIKPEAVNAIVSSWWWARRRPKHVERHKTSSNKLVRLLLLLS